MRFNLHYISVLFTAFLLFEACNLKSEKSRGETDKLNSHTADPSSAQVVSIHQAALDGNLRVISMLLDGGVNVDSLDQESRSALMYASYNGHTGIINKLIQGGASVNLGDISGTTALMMASSGPYPQAVKMLLESKADPNITDKAEHFTALMYAASEGQLEVVKILLAYEADPFLKDVDGDDALAFASRNNHTAVVNYLRSFTSKARAK